jgi:deazaflavin-dependent oxidoreductase (nitroreductase family)
MVSSLSDTSRQELRRSTVYTRLLQRLGHGRWFAVTIKHAGCKLDRALYRMSRGRVTLSGPNMPTMLLTTRGRRTGKERTTPVFYVRDGDNLVVGCENFGLQTASSWPINLRANPRAEIQIGGGRAPYEARPATEDEIDRNLPRLVAVWPAHDSYQRRSGVCHVFVFEPLP